MLSAGKPWPEDRIKLYVNYNVTVYSDLYVICILFIYNLCVILKYP